MQVKRIKPSRYFIRLSFMAAILLYTNYVGAQDTAEENYNGISIKTNLLYDATGTINIGGELTLGDRLSFELPLSYNPWTFSSNRKWKHMLVQPELRLWTKETFTGHFFGIHTHYAYYNISRLPSPPFSVNMNENRYQGWLAGAGITYGYRWNTGSRWSVEGSLGLGYAYLDYDKYPCITCAEKTKSDTRNYLGPTKASVSLIYTIGGKKKKEKKNKKKEAEPGSSKTSIKLAPPYIPVLDVSHVNLVLKESGNMEKENIGNLYFTLNSSILKDNEGALQRIDTLMETLRNTPNILITGITITGYASIEGTFAHNLQLSARRANALQEYLITKYAMNEFLFSVEGKGEDWAGIDSLVSVATLPYKNDVLEIIRSTGIFDGREKKLMELYRGEPYRAMEKSLFPQLRRCEYRLFYTVSRLSAEKAAEVFANDPYSLSLDELFLAASIYQTDSETYYRIMETAANLFPASDEANLNAAAGALQRKDTIKAGSYLSKVKEHTSAYYNNIGVLYGLLGEWDKAKEAFLQAGDNMKVAANIREIDKAIENR
ncbi:DUF3575 domain-containing protein [uncultured Dysgonomonas sp.]|uniref:DUF3575 domain-containing protein n=1 Tax=uncultured Dysgonomonas sp. TaxID=206096 RepID=UPI002804B04D|nr:DUF3575 domain-containing protein [uncultured Dysgonomonas sp.]